VPITTVKNSVLFPEIGQIRKGGVKSDKAPGRDLNEKFRVLFFPGNEGSEKKFTDSYGSLFPTKIRAMLPFASLDDCWVVYNEAYSAGRMLARADGEKYITLRDGRTGEYLVANGEPYRQFTPGDVVGYTDGRGKTQRIKIKPVGRLYLFLPDLERAVFLTLKTTSYYDAININQQLGAVAAMGKNLNNGSVAGIGIQIYRRPQSITWNQEGGNAVRIDKWLINIEVDPDWMRSAIERLSKFALTGGTQMPALESGIVGDVDPNDEGDDIPDGIANGEFEDVENAPEPEPAPASKSTPEPAPKANGAMPLEMALEVKTSEKTPRHYGDIETEELSHMFNEITAQMKKPGKTPEKLEEYQVKKSAIAAILASRNGN